MLIGGAKFETEAKRAVTAIVLALLAAILAYGLIRAARWQLVRRLAIDVARANTRFS